MAESEAVLLMRYAREQDADAFRALVEAHQHMVFAACNRVLCNRADAEDAAQNCFFTLALKAEQLRAPIAGWLHTVAVQKAIDILRRRRSRARREAAAAARVVPKEEPAWEDIRGAVDEAIVALPERWRVPIVLYYLEGRKQEEIARELGVSQPAVSGRLKRGVAVLRNHLRRKGLLASGVAIAPLLSANAMEAAPATLTAALGKMALAGVKGAAAGAGGAAGGFGLLKAAVAVVAAMGVLLGCAWLVIWGVQRALASHRRPDRKPPAVVVTTEAAAPAEMADTSAGARSLEPVIERVLGKDDAGTDMFIDFDTGRLFSMPPDAADVEPMLEWMRSTGADALYEKRMSARSLIGADLAMAPMQNDRWHTLTPGQLAGLRSLGQVKEAFPVFIGKQGALPQTFAFRTREGGIGVLQIVGFGGAGRWSVELHYKIAAPGGAAAWATAANLATVP